MVIAWLAIVGTDDGVACVDQRRPQRGKRQRMKRTLVSEAIRHAVFVQLSLGTQVLAGCGAKITSPSASDPVPTDAAVDDVASDVLQPISGEGAADALPLSDGGMCSVISYASYVAGACEDSLPFNGSPAECGADYAGNFSAAQCEQWCPPPYVEFGRAVCWLVPSSTTGESSYRLACYYAPCPIGGRRPEGLGAFAPVASRHASAVFLSHTAFLEAASVFAFARLERELTVHRAPRRLRSLARRATRDEVRHARVVKAFAERAGARVPSPCVESEGVRTLEAIAVENAVEGCVRETFGAAVAMLQSKQAREPSFRAAMTRIADDETRHAELAWAVATWLDGRLGPSARRRVRQAMREAAEAVLSASALPPPPELVAELGLPTADQGRAIARAFSSRLWERTARGRRA